MNMDRSAANFRAGEQRRLSLLPKAMAARRNGVAEGDSATDGINSPLIPKSILVSQRQEELNRQMERALFGVPKSRKVMSSRASAAVSALSEGEPSNLAYASSEELMEEINGSGDPSRCRETNENLLSFGSNRTPSTRIPDSYGGIDIINSTPATLPDPFSLDIHHVIRRYGGSNKSGFTCFHRMRTTPQRIFVTPNLKHDFYLNLMSWSEKNILAVALGDSVFLLNCSNNDFQMLFRLPGAEERMEEGAHITSVAWSKQPGHEHLLAVGTSMNSIQIWDALKVSCIRVLKDHTDRVSSLSWNPCTHVLSSGAEDGMIYNHDIRATRNVAAKLKGHEQDVCGLRWNIDGSAMASGGNDHLLCLWDVNMPSKLGANSVEPNQNGFHRPRYTSTAHTAAIKALAWSPYSRHRLLTGGGSSDQTIKTWKTAVNFSLLNSIDAGSQVCGLEWSMDGKEIVSAHGYSQSQLTLWKYPSMEKIQDFKSHKGRVLNLDLSPDGRRVASLSEDETLRIWNMFDRHSSIPHSAYGICGVQLGNCIIR